MHAANALKRSMIADMAYTALALTSILGSLLQKASAQTFSIFYMCRAITYVLNLYRSGSNGDLKLLTEDQFEAYLLDANTPAMPNAPRTRASGF